MSEKTDKKEFSKEEAQAMVDKAVAKAMSALQRQEKTVMVAHPEKEKEKPDRPPGNRDIPDEHFLKEEFVVFHARTAHVMTGFVMKDGRVIDPPRSKVIVFRQYPVSDGIRFGKADSLNIVCVYRTRDAREKKLFEEDARWMDEFWPKSKNNILSQDKELLNLVGQYSIAMMDVSTNDVRTMAKDIGLPADTDIGKLRVMIAQKRAEKEMKERAQIERSEQDKEALLTQ